MGSNSGAATAKRLLWAGWVVTALPALMLLFSGVMKFVKPQAVLDQMASLGWDADLLTALGIVEILCTALYLFPRTCVLGAVLLTGYLGGAVATHVRVEDQFVMPVVVGVLVWGGLFLRDSRVRALLPVRAA